MPNLQLNEIAFSTNQIQKHSLPLDVLNDVGLQNIGVKRQANEIKIAESQLLLEKAERAPNLTLQMNYDRGGNIMRDFIGFGVSVDLPIFNNNKGNIKASDAMVKQQQSTLFSMEHSVKQTVVNLHEQLNRLSTTLNNWPSKDTEGQLQILENYKKHLQNKQITLLEFIDFTQAYRQANQAFFQLQETYNTTLEELQYTVGKDL
nr:TolC family protein [Flavobacterium sp. xlx-221]